MLNEERCTPGVSSSNCVKFRLMFGTEFTVRLLSTWATSARSVFRISAPAVTLTVWVAPPTARARFTVCVVSAATATFGASAGEKFPAVASTL